MKIWRDLLFYLLLAVVLLWVVLKVQNPASTQVARLSYLQFKQEVAAGKIKTAVIDNNSGQIWGKYKERDGIGLGPNGATEYRTAGPLRTDLLEPLLDRYQVEYEYKPIGNSLWPLLLGQLLPVLLIGGFMFFLLNQMQNSGNKALAFGKSRARLHQEQKTKVTFDEVAGQDDAKEALMEIVEFLKTWRPPDNAFREPSPEGLGRVLSSVVAQDPGPFAVEAKRFQGLDPTYIRAVLSGLRDALKQGGAFDWEPVLDLCGWALSQPRETPGRQVGEEMEADPDWGWTRKAIAGLLSAGFEDGPGSVPIPLRVKVWHILQPLTEDPDPTPEHEERYGGSYMDPATLSINTTRGEAMHAVVRYALWVRRHMEGQADAEDQPRRGFDEMPEVREVLDAHLDVAQEPSLAIRAVYGQWFPWLVLLDSKWARDNAARIFPIGQGEEALLEAAWNSYVTFCRPYDNVLDILREQYRHAAERIGCRRDDTRWLANPDERLAEHLMVFYWRGKLSLEDPLLTAFWENATDALRGHALGYVGHALEQTSGEIPAEVLERLTQLWAVRLAWAKQSQSPTDLVKEMAAFGWWFVSDKFDVGWAIAQLSESLQLVHQTDLDHMVLEHLARTVESHPVESAQCLRIIAEGDREGWTLSAGRDHVRRILEVALRNPTAGEEAERIIHYLGSRGFLEFRNLLEGERRG